jgi:hypothetical protein
MATISYQDVSSLPDALLDDRFALLVTPPAGSSGDTTQGLTLRCMNAAMGGTSIEQILVSLNGFNTHFRGRRMYPFVLAVAYQETNDGFATTALREWVEYIVGADSGNGVSKKDYAVSATLQVFNEQGNVAIEATFENLWILDVQDVQVSGQAAQQYLVQASFSYDRVVISGVSSN